VLCSVDATLRTLLSGERTALNFLQLLSATATAARRYVAALGGSATRILDTRKTIPGLRIAQKYAVRIGGACNHRLGLFDAVLIKENHIAACGGIRPAIERARVMHPQLLIEIEVESLEEFREAQAAGPDRIMLDELSPEDLRQAIAERKPGIALELSGGVGLDQIQSLATLGVDFISVGAITKHIRAVDLSMRIERTGIRQRSAGS
jgi:nicotinate-nucleotide pyrophosphorylase (carboxylating)